MNPDIHITKKKEDGTTLDIRVTIMDNKLYISDVGVKAKRKRNFTYIGNGKLFDNYTYRSLDKEGKQNMKLRMLIEECGEDALREALNEAWESLKPSEVNVW
ncbi:hypothetical protein [Bacillus sp. NEAU-Y102]